MFVDRVYPDQHIHSQATGRWSTVDPPLATVPPRLRPMLIPDEGHAFIKFDLDQVEPRIIAAIANDAPMLSCFSKGWDYHTMNFCSFFEVERPPNMVDPHKAVECEEWRQRLQWEGKDDKRRVFSKTFALRLQYRGDPRFASDIPGASKYFREPKKLQQAARAWLYEHPAIQVYWNKMDQIALKERAVRTFMGRRRALSSANPLLGTRNPAAMLREASNHPIQGGVADVFNHLVIRISRALPHIQWVVGAHDGQTWQCPVARVQESVEVMKEIIATPWDVHGVRVVLPATFEEVRYGRC